MDSYSQNKGEVGGVLRIWLLNCSYLSIYEYKMNYYCHDDPDFLGCEHICKCCRITDVEFIEILSPEPSIIKDELLYWVSDSDMRDWMTYAFLRAFHYLDLDKESSWIPIIDEGYYGDCFLGGSLSESVLKTFCEWWFDFVTSDFDEQVRQLLVLEYGFVLENLMDAKFSLQRIPREDVELAISRDYPKISQERVGHYRSSPSLIEGIVRPLGQKFKVIDGNHRWLASEGKPDSFLYVVANEDFI